MYSLDQIGTVRLRPSHEFSLTYDLEGQGILYDFSRPERCFRISPKAATLLACFYPAPATSIEDAIARYCRHLGIARSLEMDSSILQTVNQLVNMRGLTPEFQTQSAYTREMVSPYIRARNVPAQVCNIVKRYGAIGRDTRVLDVATGTGSVALKIGAASAHVTGIDLSEPFLQAARQRAAEAGLSVTFRPGCGNRVGFQASRWDVITIAQAYHWLDPVISMRGFKNGLVNGGFLFFIESNALLPAKHPLHESWQYGFASARALHKAFRDQAITYRMRAAALGGNVGTSRLECTGTWIVRERHLFDADFARALFCTNQTLTADGQERSSWQRLVTQLSTMPAAKLQGYMYWQVLRFEKRAKETRLSTVHPHVQVRHSGATLAAG